MKNLKKIFFGLIAIALLFSFIQFTDNSNNIYALSETTPVIVSVDEILVDQETNMGGAPTAMIGQEYLAQVVATGENLTFSAGANGYMKLPEGLTINSTTGIISGTCTDNVGRYNVYIEVSNSVGNAHAVIGITVGDASNIPVISTESGKIGTIYKDSISVLNITVQNDATYSIYNFKWSLKSGELPEGMNLVYTSSSTLNISGIPTQTGTFTFELEAKNDCGSDVKTFSIEVIEGSIAPNIVEFGYSLGYGVVGLPYEYQLEASGTNSNEDPMFWSTSSSDFSQESYSLGNGLTLSKNGLITGTIQNNSQINFTVYVKNSKGTDNASFYIVIYDNGKVSSATITPEVTVMAKGSSKEFTISLEGYGNVEQVAYWSFYMWDDELDGAFPQPTDSELSVNTSTPSKTVTLSIGENEERQQIRVVAYSEPGNGGIKTWATITIIEDNSINQSTALQNVQLNNGVLTWDAFPGAAEYEYLFGPGGGYFSDPTLDLEYQAKLFHLETGEYNYTIYAVDEYRTRISDKLTGTYSYTNTQTPIDAPTNLEWNHTVASWDEVEGAEYYVLLIYEYNNGIYNLITAQGTYVYGLSYDMGRRFEVGKTYCFDVKACVPNNDLDHINSEYARSSHHTFESVVPALTNVTVENGWLSFDAVTGASKYEILISNGGGNYESLPIDLYTLCSEINLENGTYDIIINVFNENNEPLAPKYIYENWEYDSSLAPTPLTGTVQITGTLKVGETLTATLNDSNNTGTLTYSWYRSDPLESWILVQTGTSNTFIITEPCANKRISVVVTSDKEISQVESENTGVIAEADKAEILNGTVQIIGTLKYGETLTANVTSNNTGTLSYQWKRNGVDISGATSQTYTLTIDDIGKILRVVVTSSVETGEIPSEVTTTILKADNLVAPTGITATDCTTIANNDGTIVGVTTLMEYKLSTANNWTNVTSIVVTGLANGTYKIRFKETETQSASAETTVTINEYEEIDDGLIRNIEITGMPEIVLGETVPCDKNILSIPNDAKYEIQNIGWFDFTADEWVNGNDVFISGHSYQFSVDLVAKDEYEFANEITATINGNFAEVYKNGNIIMVKYLVGNPIQYTITFDAGEGTGSMEPVVAGGNYTLPECTFIAPEGMVFDKWSITDIGYKNANDVIMITQNITITAIWKEKPVVYTLTFNAGGGNGSMNEVEIESGNLYLLPNCLFTPANEYLMFKEWNVSDIGPRPVGYNLTIYNNHTITAVWIHKCKLTPVEEVGANCATETNGKQAHYVCHGCEKKYSDENGEHLIQNFENWGVIQYEHNYTGDLVIRDASTHGFECINANCSAVGNYIQHSFETWKSNAEEHWKVCECGQTNNLNYHNNPEKITGKSSSCEELGWKDYYQCECGKLFSDENCEHIIDDLDAWKLGDGKIDYTHNHTSEWKTDKTKHWNQCLCGENKSNKNYHTDRDNNGKCDTCDYQMTPTNPSTTPSTTPSTKTEKKGIGAGGIIAIVIVSILIFGSGGFAIFWFVIKKKTWADFISRFKKK